MHNYGEAFMDRRLVEKVRYAKQKGIREVGMISNGSLITEPVARGMIEAGLDAINISVDASGKEVFEATRIGLKYDKVIANIERLLRLRDESGKRRPKLILSFVRQNNSADEQAFIEHWRTIADKIHVTDLHNWAGTLNTESDVNYPVLPPLADVHGAVGRPGVALLRRLRRQDDSWRSEHPDDRGSLERGALSECPPRAPRERRPRRVPRLRSPAKRLSPLGHKAGLGRPLFLPSDELAPGV